MKTLNIIQTLAKIAKIFTKILYICCIVGIVGCIVGMISIPFGDTGIIKIGGVSVYGLIANKTGESLTPLYPTLVGALIICIGQMITAKYSEKYLTNELSAGTPFTQDGAKELLRLGIITAAVPLGTGILAQIVSEIIVGVLDCGEAFELDTSESVAIGLMLIVASLLCQYGASIQAEKDDGAE